MELIPIRTAEVADTLMLMRGIAYTHTTLNINYQTVPPTWSEYAVRTNRVGDRAAMLVLVVQALERRKKDVMMLPAEWNLPDVEAALLGMRALLEDEVYGDEGRTDEPLRKIEADRADGLRHRYPWESQNGNGGQ